MYELWMLENMAVGNLPITSMPMVRCPKCDGFPKSKYSCNICEGSGRVNIIDARLWVSKGGDDINEACE